MRNKYDLKSLLLIGLKVYKRHYLWYVFIMIIFGLSVPVFIEIQKNLIDTASVHSDTFSMVYLLIPYIVGYFIFYYLDTIGMTISNYLQTKILYKVEYHLMTNYLEDVSYLDYEAFENNEIQNKMMRISKEQRMVYHKSIAFIPNVLKTSIELGSILFFMIGSGVWWGYPIAIILSIPSFYFNKKRTQYARKVYSQDSSEIRYANYLNDTLLNKEYAKERRFFRIYNYLSYKWNVIFTHYNKNKLNAYIKSSIATGIAMCFSMSVIFIVGLTLLDPLKTGVITIGLYTALLVAVSSKMNQGINTIMKEYSNITQLKYFVEDYNKLQNISTNIDEDHLETVIAFESIEFDDVWFAYPNTDTFILKGVSFKINKGESHALIGVNGAGKTTITKLMLGLYKPTKGTIYLNGKDMSQFSYQSIQKLYAAIEQNFAKYKGSLLENICLYELNNEINEEQLNKTLNRCHTVDLLVKLKNSYYTNLTPELPDGIMPSGGQWQKIAISRALFSKRNFLIFDEPTAALDPIAEVSFYDTYKNLMKGHTSLFITHRLGSIYLFENCFVLSEGKIVELGSHDSLMKQEGLYKQLFEKQKSWYQIKGGT